MKALARAAGFAALVGWAGLFLPMKINLATADIGRHLQNGRAVAALLAHPAPETAGVLNRNFYSYTNPDFPTLNHHWGSGLVFWAVHRAAGFEGLCVLQALMLLAAWSLMLALAVRRGGFGWAAVWALWLVPVFTARREIRPEAFSVLLAAAYVFLLERHADGRLRVRRLAAFLVPLQVLWTNLHIYFILGPLVAGAYAARAVWERRDRQLVLVLAGVCAATLANPFGVHGALYPFFVFGDYGYRLVENQSVPFLERLKVVLPSFRFFKTASIALACAAVLEALAGRRENGRPAVPSAGTVLALVFAAAGWRAIRNFQLFAVLALPALAGAFGRLTAFHKPAARSFRTAAMAMGAVAAVAAATADFGGHPWKPMPGFGFGVMPDATASADFFREEGLHGPIFNNYDIGGFLIYTLWPAERVFVDNRPEAYPGRFFRDVLVPAQEDDARWRALDDQYRFNVIFFGYHDLTPWAQSFLRRRIDDPEWAPVFADAYAIVFLRRTVENSPVIVRRELPRSMFRVIENGQP